MLGTQEVAFYVYGMAKTKLRSEKITEAIDRGSLVSSGTMEKKN